MILSSVGTVGTVLPTAPVARAGGTIVSSMQNNSNTDKPLFFIASSSIFAAVKTCTF